MKLWKMKENLFYAMKGISKFKYYWLKKYHKEILLDYNKCIAFFVKIWTQISHTCYKSYREKLKIIIWMSLILMPEKHIGSSNRNIEKHWETLRNISQKETSLIITNTKGKQIYDRISS